ncbi:hypothetical protein D3C87_1701470 [compost metagenome]
MINAARRLSPDLKFDTGDLLNIAYPKEHLGSAVAFYSIVHFDIKQVKNCFEEINRVLKPGGEFLLAFHAGDEIVHFDEAHDKEVDIDMYYFKTDDIIALLKAAGFYVIDAMERPPHEGMEYQSRRAYIWAEKK